MKIRLGLLALVVSISSTHCITDGSKKPDSNLEYLNGENYKSSSARVGIVPVPPTFQRRNKNTHISGKVYFVHPETQLKMPVKFSSLELVKGDILVGRLNTDEKGLFTFSEDIPDGPYVIRLETETFKGEKSLFIEGYEYTDIDLEVSRRS